MVVVSREINRIMKQILLSLSLGVTLTSFSQNACLKDSTYSFYNNAAIVNNTPIITHFKSYNAARQILESIGLNDLRDTTAKNTYLYNSQSKVTKYLYQDYISGAFVNSYVEDYTYLADTLLSQLKSASVYNASTNSWTYDYEENHTYNDPTHVNLPTVVEKRYLNASSVQTNGNKTMNTYNSNGKLASYIYQVWDNNTSSYVNSSNYVYSYNSSNLNDTTYGYGWFNNSWIPMSKNVRMYNSNGKLTQIDGYNYPVSSGLTLQNRTIYYYDAQSNLDSSRYYSYNGTTLDLQYVEYHFQNNAGQDTLVIGKSVANGSYVNASHVSYSFNADNYLIHSLNQSWDGTNAVWVSNSKQDIYYDCFSVAGVNDVESEKWSVYPNPFTDAITIVSAENALASIINQQGQVLQSFFVHQGQNQMELSNLPAGTYFIQSSTGKVEKLVKK